MRKIDFIVIRYILFKKKKEHSKKQKNARFEFKG